MLFDPNQTEFAGDYQRVIWQYGIHIVPPEASLAGVEDKETRKGCMQIYDCVMEILTEMYTNPEKYKEAYPNGYNAVYLAWLVSGIKVSPFKKDIDAFARNTHKNSHFGFTYDTEKDAWSNDRYPLVCEYLTRFATVCAKNVSTNMGNYVQRLDFRLFAKRIVHTFDDLLRPLPDKVRACFLELREYALSTGMAEGNGAYSSSYAYKGMSMLSLHNDPACVWIPYGQKGLKPIPGYFERFLEIAEKQPDADTLVPYIRDNINICDDCGYLASSKKRKEKGIRKNCGYYWVDIRGVKLLSCFASKIRKYGIINDEDVRILKRLIDIRIEQIDSLEKREI